MDLVKIFRCRISKDILFSPGVCTNSLGRNGQSEWEFAVNFVSTFHRKLSVKKMDKNNTTMRPKIMIFSEM